MPFSYVARWRRWISAGLSWVMLRSVARLARWFFSLPRLTARGQLRCRRGGLSRWTISPIAVLIVLASRLGGKRRLVGDLAADDPQAAHEGDPVEVDADVVGGFEHQVPDRVVGQQQRPDFLPGQLW